MQRAGLALEQYLDNEVIDLRLRGHCVEILGHAGQLAVNAEEAGEVAVAHGVVDLGHGGLQLLARRTNNVDDRHVLRVGPRDGVGGGELAHAEGSEECADAAQAGVSIGRISGVELVGVAHPTNLLVGHNVVEELEIEIAGNTESSVMPTSAKRSRR